MVEFNNKQKNNDFSQDLGNAEIVKSEVFTSTPAVVKDDSSSSVSVSPDGINVKRSGNFVIGSLNIITNPIRSGVKKRHEKHYQSGKFHLIVDVILALVVIGLVSSFLIIKTLPTKVNLGVDSKLVGLSAISGEVSSFEVEYQNPSKSSISDASIAVNFPDNFSVVNVSPAGIFNETNNTFEIGNLPSGANGIIKIDGLVWGELGASQVITFSFNYLTNNKHQNNVLNSLIYSIDSSALDFGVDVDSRVYKDIPFKGKIILKNNSTFNIDNDIELILKNKNFEILEINSTDAVLNNNAITLSSLAAGEKTELEFIAVSATDETNSIFELDSFINIYGAKIRQGSVSERLSIAIPNFKVQTSLDKDVVREGEEINLKINYDNQEDVALSNIKFDLGVSDSAFRIKGLSGIDSGKFDIFGTAIVFKESVPSGSGGSFYVNIALERKNISLNQEVAVLMDIAYDMEDERIEYTLYSNYIKFVSDLQIGSSGLYYSSLGDQLGIGPLPPIVGVPTRYWVFWEVNNLGNVLKDLSVSATLPSNVFWTDQKSLIAGKLRYGDITKKVNWSLDEVDAIDGKYKVGFEIELVPGEDDLGEIVDILTDVSYSAFDTFTNTEISGKLENINTDIKYDNVASGKGEVVRMNVVR